MWFEAVFSKQYAPNFEFRNPMQTVIQRIEEGNVQVRRFYVNVT